MAQRSHLSIGEVLSTLRDEFPDVTISKIRFLESQGLVDPERTPSGYRKFYDHDVTRLRWILTQQREHFLPLKVIKDRLDGRLDDVAPGGPLGSVATSGGEVGSAPATSGEQLGGADAGHSEERFTIDELAAAAGLDADVARELEQFGLLGGKKAGGGSYGTDALGIARAAAVFTRHGIEARHLRAWRNGAEREVNLFQQIVSPQLRQRDPRARLEAKQTLAELARVGGDLRRALVDQALHDLH